MEVSLAASPAVSLTAFKAFPSAGRSTSLRSVLISYGASSTSALAPHRGRPEVEKGTECTRLRGRSAGLKKEILSNGSFEAECESDRALARVLHFEDHRGRDTAGEAARACRGIRNIVFRLEAAHREALPIGIRQHDGHDRIRLCERCIVSHAGRDEEAIRDGRMLFHIARQQA